MTRGALTWPLLTLLFLTTLVAACSRAVVAPGEPSSSSGPATGSSPGAERGNDMGMSAEMGDDMGPGRSTEMDAASGMADAADMGMAAMLAQRGRPVDVPGGRYWDISVADLRDALAQKDFFLLNVHIPFTGNIPGTDANIPYNALEAYAAQLPADRDTPIVVYCRSGAMSTAAARTLVGMGYTQVFQVTGGMNAWQALGEPLEVVP